MNTLKEALDKRGLKVKDAARKELSYYTLYAQYKGRRQVGAACAVRIEALLGIPRSELRPDLWSPALPPETDAVPVSDADPPPL